MRRSMLLVVAILTSSSLAAAATSVHVGVGTPSLQFDFLYADFGVAPERIERDVASVGEADLLVALQLAQVSGFDIDVIIGWRRNGISWDTITRNCRHDAVIYYVELPSDVSGPPYGRAHGYWKKHGKRDPKLSDAEIRELVLVQALAKHCKTSSVEIVRSRAAGRSPKAIATESRSTRSKEDATPPVPKSKGHGKDKSGKGR